MTRASDEIAGAVAEARKRPRPVYTPCEACHNFGVLEWGGDFKDIPLRYCSCSEGQRLARQAEQDRQEWMAWRQNSLYRHLNLPKEPDAAGLRLVDYTFATYQDYQERMGQPRAPEHLHKALAFLENWDRRRWVILTGKNGNCKTGLMICIVKALLSQALKEGWDVQGTLAYQPQSWYACFIRSLDFIHRLQDGFDAEKKEQKTSAIREELEKAPLLAFDDFGKGNFTPWAMQEYSSLFDYRAMTGLPTFITTNLSIKQMREQFGDYLIGRMLQKVDVIRVVGADTRFISLLLDNPDLSPEDVGIEDEPEPSADDKQLRLVKRPGA